MSLPLGWLARKKESPQQDLWRQRHHMWRELRRRETLPHTHTHTHTNTGWTQTQKDRWWWRWRSWCCCSWGQTLTQSNTAKQTPPDRWNVKISPVCAFQQRAVWFCHMPGRNNPTHTKKNHKLAIERTIFMVTHLTNSTLLTIYNMCNLTRC